jgi:hypothetical protein
MGLGVLDCYIHQITEGTIGNRGKDNQQNTEKKKYATRGRRHYSKSSLPNLRSGHRRSVINSVGVFLVFPY